jgi:ribosome-interacting GTPase 1
VAVRCNASLVAGNNRTLHYTVSKYIALHAAALVGFPLVNKQLVFLTAAIDRERALQSSTAGIVQLSLAYHEMKFNTLNIPQIYFLLE